MNKNVESAEWAPKTFFNETISGILIFLTIALAAIGLSLFIKYLEHSEVDMVIISGLKAAEYGIFFVDLLLFSRFLYKTALKTWREL